LGDPDIDRYDVEYHRGFLTLDHRFSENLQLRSIFAVQSSLSNDTYVNLDDLEPDGRTLPRSYSGSLDGRLTEDFSWQTDLISTFNTGSVSHQLLLGLELSRNNTVYGTVRGDFPSQDIFDPVYGLRPTNIIEPSYQENTRINTTGIYLQDQITLLPNLRLLIGGRYDFVDRSSIAESLGDLSTSEFSDSAFSPRVGLVYQPIEPISLYASYSQSFNPNNATTANDEPLEPSRGTQYEIGAKFELFDGRLFATLAAYEITKTNIPTVDPDNTDFSIAAGEATSRGIEFDISGEILPSWNIIASAFLNDAFISEDNDPTLDGNQLTNAPETGASLWTTYEIQSGDLEELGFGAGIFYVGDRFANQSDLFRLPSYVRTDAAIYYRRDNWRAALNFRNLFDIEYYNTNGFIVFPQAPFTVLGTVSVTF
jgi:iron complex outermembrane receptor protein